MIDEEVEICEVIEDVIENEQERKLEKAILKAKDFKPYLNHSLGIEFNDLDHEYDMLGNKLTFSEFDSTILVPCSITTIEERDAIWDKYVIAFDIKNEKNLKKLVLTISKFINKEVNEVTK